MPGPAASTRTYLAIFIHMSLPRMIITDITTMIMVIAMMDSIMLNLSRTTCPAGTPANIRTGLRSMGAYSAITWHWGNSLRLTPLRRSIALL